MSLAKLMLMRVCPTYSAFILPFVDSTSNLCNSLSGLIPLPGVVIPPTVHYVPMRLPEKFCMK